MKVCLHYYTKIIFEFMLNETNIEESFINEKCFDVFIRYKETTFSGNEIDSKFSI